MASKYAHWKNIYIYTLYTEMILFTCLIQKIRKTIASMVNGHYLPLFLTHMHTTFKDHEYGNVLVQDKSSSSSLTYSADP